MKRKPPPNIDRIFAKGTPIDEAIRAAALEAVEVHRRAGVPLVGWRDGQVVYVPAEEIRPPRNGPRRAKAAPRRT